MPILQGAADESRPGPEPMTRSWGCLIWREITKGFTTMVLPECLPNQIRQLAPTRRLDRHDNLNRQPPHRIQVLLNHKEPRFSERFFNENRTTIHPSR